MYKVTVTADGTTATASKHCSSIQEAEGIKAKLAQLLKKPIRIDIVSIGRRR